MRVAPSANLAGVLPQLRSERRSREPVCPVFRTPQTAHISPQRTWVSYPSKKCTILGTYMEAVPFVLGKSGRGQESHFQLAYCSRRAVFLNLPTEVRGMASAKTNASGSCHFAKVFPRNARNSSGAARAPSFRTTTARGRSCHLG